MEYLDFEVEVTPGESGDYDVHVRSEYGEASGKMRLPFDTLALQNRLQALQIALLRSGSAARRVATPEEETVQVFGRELFDALFTGPVLGRFEATRDGAWQREVGMRLKLRIAASELAALPWEYLYDPGRGDFLGLSVATPMVRYIPLPRPIRALTIRPPIRILGMIAASSDLPAIDSAREKQRLETALAPLVGRGVVELEWLPSGTWRDLQEWLLNGPWHVFHFIGHGGFDEVRAEGFLYLPGEAGKAIRLPATGLGRLLGDHDPMRLAVLNACEGARADNLDVFSSTAASLVQRGTPAVVAMQYEITDRAAIEFSRSFYTAIAEGRPVDASLAVARKSISLEIPGSFEWGTPALYMRSPDGVLFDLAAVPPTRVEAPATAPSKEPEPTPEVPTTPMEAGLAAPPAEPKIEPRPEPPPIEAEPTSGAPVAAVSSQSSDDSSRATMDAVAKAIPSPSPTADPSTIHRALLDGGYYHVIIGATLTGLLATSLGPGFAEWLGTIFSSEKDPFGSFAQGTIIFSLMIAGAAGGAYIGARAAHGSRAGAKAIGVAIVYFVLVLLVTGFNLVDELKSSMTAGKIVITVLLMAFAAVVSTAVVERFNRPAPDRLQGHPSH